MSVCGEEGWGDGGAVTFAVQCHIYRVSHLQQNRFQGQNGINAVNEYMNKYITHCIHINHAYLQYITYIANRISVNFNCSLVRQNNQYGQSTYRTQTAGIYSCDIVHFIYIAPFSNPGTLYRGQDKNSKIQQKTYIKNTREKSNQMNNGIN